MMATTEYHLHSQAIPDGFQIFEDRLEVADIGSRREDAASFAKSYGPWLEFEREHGNTHDEHAIRVIGCNGDLHASTRRFIGYVPKDVAQLISEHGFWGRVRPRLLKTHIEDNGHVEILFQIVGPKGLKYEYCPPLAVDGGHYTEYVDRVDQLKAEKKYDEAIELLLTLVCATEREAKTELEGVAPWYYQQLAAIYRKRKRYDDEVAILERYESQPKAHGAGPRKLAERLVKARQLRDKHRA